MNVCLVCARVCDGWKAETKGVKNRILSLTPLASPSQANTGITAVKNSSGRDSFCEERICAAAATSDRRPAPHTLRWTSNPVS